ncbi:hypothetical protein WL77_06365 [Burkholderia ubonensis]|uniref:hypothetical protein n=1 Tax=Burkholderia ubonensis TaxID=101571 RepID=UPI00075D15C1|nr:hypothetical protein [Burkholderia ubonensis]KWE75109.1 hypothetical protein WL77_06365 [Burkholderia ubonensis]KWE77444.1 hypothetical protein WL79_07545 [Burkholderia ubonensis]
MRGDDPVSPVTAVAAVPATRLDAPVLNSYEFGGYLVFRHVKPFVDGRADIYGGAFMCAYFDALKPDRAALERLVERYRIRWAPLAAPARSPRPWRSCPDGGASTQTTSRRVRTRRPVTVGDAAAIPRYCTTARFTSSDARHTRYRTSNPSGTYTTIGSRLL